MFLIHCEAAMQLIRTNSSVIDHSAVFEEMEMACQQQKTPSEQQITTNMLKRIYCKINIEELKELRKRLTLDNTVLNECINYHDQNDW